MTCRSGHGRSDATLLIVDGTLTPIQQKNLETRTELKVIETVRH